MIRNREIKNKRLLAPPLIEGHRQALSSSPLWAKESGQAVECAVVFVKVYCTKDGRLVSTEVRDKIIK